MLISVGVLIFEYKPVCLYSNISPCAYMRGSTVHILQRNTSSWRVESRGDKTVLPMCACVACTLKRGIPFSRCVRKIKTMQVAVKRVTGVSMHWIVISQVQKCFELVSEIVIEM